MFHIVDDANFIRSWVSETIREHGYASQAFNSPDSYLEFANSSDYTKPIAVFVDINLPVMNGYDMISAVSERQPGLKFVVMTGEPGIRSSHADMACMFLAKPFGTCDIANVLNSVIRCHAFSPAGDHGCTKVDDRKMFPVERWACPHQCASCHTNSDSIPINFWPANLST